MADRIPDASGVLKLWGEAHRALLSVRRDFWLNYSFYSGEQWLQWNSTRGWVEAMPDRQEHDPHRITVNQIGPRIDSLIGRFISRRLAWESQPTGVDSDAHRGGKLGEFILDSENEEQNWEAIRQEVLLQALCGGTAAVMVRWDSDYGDTYTEPTTGETVHVGCSALEPLTIAEFSLQPGVRRPEDATWWIAQTLEPPEVVQERYGLANRPKPDSISTASALQRKLLTASSSEDSLCKVTRYFRRPTKTEPKGCEVHVVGEQVVRREQEWPYPFKDRLNVRPFRCRPTRQWYGQTFVSGCRSPQVSINEIHSAILDHVELVSNVRLLVPYGATVGGADEFTNLVGEVIQFYSEAGQPSYMPPPEMPRYPREALDRLTAAIDDMLYTHATSRGELVGSRNSGLALSLVTEKDDSPLAVMARDQASGWGEIGTMVLQMYEAKADVPRPARRTTEAGGVVVKEWAGPDLNGQVRVRVPIDAALPNSKVATQAAMIALKNAFPEQFAALDPFAVARTLELPVPNLIGALADHHAALAEYENEQMFDGEEMVPDDFHDHAKHIAQHNRARSTPAYLHAAPDVKWLFDMHVKAHARLAQDEQLGQAELEQAMPGASAFPQGDAPDGSAIPPTAQQDMAAAAMAMASNQGSPPA